MPYHLYHSIVSCFFLVYYLDISQSHHSHLFPFTAHLWGPLTHLPFSRRRRRAAVCAAILLPLCFGPSFIWPFASSSPHPHAQAAPPVHVFLTRLRFCQPFIGAYAAPSFASRTGMKWNGMASPPPSASVQLAHSSLSQRLHHWGHFVVVWPEWKRLVQLAGG